VKINKRQTKILSTKKDSVKVRCAAKGMPRPKFKFILPNRKVINNGNLTVKELSDEVTSAEYTLPIGYRSVMCEATNRHGKDVGLLNLPLRGNTAIFYYFILFINLFHVLCGTLAVQRRT